MKVLIDHMNIVFISYSMARRDLKERGIEEFTEEHVGFFYHILLNKYHNLFRTYGQLIICHEGKNSLAWRRKIYPDYKMNRKASKSEDSYKVLKETFGIIEELLDNYPCKQIRVDECEGDDCMFALAEKLGKEGEEVLVISTDGDLVQLLDLEGDISLYSPVKRAFAKPIKDIVKFKAIVGDASDNIPGLYRVGKKTFEKMMVDKNLFVEKMKGDNLHIYERFLKIVNLKAFPNEKHDEIKKQYDDLPFNAFNGGAVESFLFEKNMPDQLHRWGNMMGSINVALLDNGYVDLNEFSGVKKKDIETEKTGETDLDGFLDEFC